MRSSRPLPRMAPSVWKWLALALLTPLSALTAPIQQEYAVVLSDPPLGRHLTSRRDLGLPVAVHSIARIRRAQATIRRAIEARHIPVHSSAHLLVNAIFIRASAEAAESLRGVSGVSRVEYIAPLRRQMDRAIGLLHAPEAWASLGDEASAGVGIKIGVIDTGIDQDHPAFRDDSLAVPDGFPKGDPAYTNRKVIVARSYVSLLPSPDDTSPRDHSGHGTAAGMIAAGVRNSGPAGTITGIAPKSYLGSYKIFGTP